MSNGCSIKVANEAAMLALGAELSRLCHLGDMIFLKGELGAGKTTLTRGFLRGLGYMGLVKSPTYALVESYQVSDKQIYHFDLYRLSSAEDLFDIGIEDYLEQSVIILVEWPERGQGVLPEPSLICEISLQDNGRLVKLISSCAQGKAIIATLALKY